MYLPHRTLLACTHFALAPTVPEHSFLIYIHHHIVTGHMHCFMSLLSIIHARLQHIREQYSEHNCHSTHFMAVDSFYSQTAASVVKWLHWL